MTSEPMNTTTPMMKLTFPNIEQLNEYELFTWLGMVDFEFMKVHSYIAEIEKTREQIIKKLEEYNHGNDTSLDTNQ